MTPRCPEVSRSSLFLAPASSVSLCDDVRLPQGRATSAHLVCPNVRRCLAGLIPSVRDSSIHAANTPRAPS